MTNVYEAMKADPDYFKQFTVKDLLLVNYQCPQMEKWVDLWTNMNHFIYTLEGEKLVNRPGNSKTLTAGSLVFLRKGAFTQGRFHEKSWKVIVFCAPDNYLQKLFSEYRSQLPLQKIPSSSHDAFIELSTNDTTDAYFYSLLPYFTQHPAPPENLLELKFRELMLNIFVNTANGGLLSYLNSISDQQKPSLTEVMEANYTYNLSLEELAKISNRSLTVFKKEFTELFKSTPGKWLVNKRLEHAQLLLITSQKSVSDISYESGFESATHFSRVFKEKFGTPPLQYRRQGEVQQA
ncbi:MAG TPA: AraC family transcriptional regulator [Puia sp.]|nr:AraC family transcriptional regulator [Puia sp.]